MISKLEKTVLLIKPSGVLRRLIGDIIKRIEMKGLSIVALKMMQMDEQILAQHYSHITDKPFYPALAASMKRTPIIACCIEGVEAIHVVRDMIGVTNGRDAAPGTIRGDYSCSNMENIVHASDSLQAAEAEITRFFSVDEIFRYDTPHLLSVYAEYEIK